MGKIERFEDLLVWQKARQLVKEVYRVTELGEFKRDYGLKDQMRRATTSVMLNIAEGFARRTNKEFGYFLFVSHGSVAEVQSILYIASDLKYLDKAAFDKLYSQCDEISRMISGLITYLNNYKNTTKLTNSKNSINSTN